jgi:transposase
MPKLSDSVRKSLLHNPWVERITDTQVLFTAEFKIHAVKMNLKGQSPKDIFLNAGIDVSLFREEFPKKSVSRWKMIHHDYGDDGFKQERRGLSSTGRPKKTSNSDDIKELQERLAYLEAENFILKKLNALAAKSRKKKDSK